MNKWSMFGWIAAEVGSIFILSFGEENKSFA